MKPVLEHISTAALNNASNHDLEYIVSTHKHWRLLPGMRGHLQFTNDPDVKKQSVECIVVDANEENPLFVTQDQWDMETSLIWYDIVMCRYKFAVSDKPAANFTPMLSDTMTRLSLVELARAAWEDDRAHVWHNYNTGSWHWYARGAESQVWDPVLGDGFNSEAHAAVHMWITGCADYDRLNPT